MDYFPTRHEEFLPFFYMDESLGYCADVNGLLKRPGIQTYVPEDLRISVDSSRRSLKLVLLHNGNQCASASVPLARSTTMKEKYEEMKVVLENISYYEHNCVICADFKMNNFFNWTAIGLHETPMFYLLVG